MTEMQVFSASMNENLINDLLDMAKLKNNKLKIQKEKFNLIQAIQNSFNVINHSSKQRGINLNAIIDNK